MRTLDQIKTMAGMFLAIVFLFNSQSLAQSKGVSPKSSAPRPVSEISDKDWGLLAGALSREEWSTSAKLASDYIERLEKENEKRQLAQLRYIHLFALAGNLNSLIVGKNRPAIEPARGRLDEAAASYGQKELVMPPRAFAPTCVGKVNFICPVRDNAKALRVSATNKDGDAILSFDYVLFDDSVRLYDLEERKVFLGGVLERAEFNNDPTKPWIMRLFFKKGFARVSVGQ